MRFNTYCVGLSAIFALEKNITLNYTSMY